MKEVNKAMGLASGHVNVTSQKTNRAEAMCSRILNK